MKARNHAEAMERALKRYDELVWRAKQGLAQHTVSFSAAADNWLEELEAGSQEPLSTMGWTTTPDVCRCSKDETPVQPGFIGWDGGCSSTSTVSGGIED